ncbi:MAG: hypothetical protein PHI12_07820 [Dehalococcoidales bacterium]|jgi:hypothetical protein|nr:hypothetical protein [Dehalococcoidales bacterium]
MTVDIGSTGGYRTLLEYVSARGVLQTIRGQQYLAIVPDTFYSEYKDPAFFQCFRQFNEYLGKARVDYIQSNFKAKALRHFLRTMEDEPCSRQEIFYKPDWWWDGASGHVNCVLAYQPMIQDERMDLHVFMRSSDLWNAFPFDWYAQNEHLRFFQGLYNAKIKRGEISTIQDVYKAATDPKGISAGRVYWHTSNLHVRQADLEAILDFMKEFRF